MRGDRRSSERQPVGRQNAADASSGTFYRSVSAGSRGSLTCARACVLLAAYRRDDWAPGDVDALSEHLTACAECRQREAAYRQAGERIRQLPAITPPPEFRARVFAAIRAEEMRVAPAVARLARAATNPAMPAIHPTIHRSRRPRVALTVRSAMALAAVLLFSLITARVLIAFGITPLGKTAANLNGATMNAAAGGHVAHYSIAGGYTFASSALATASWLVYSASDPAHGYMLFAENRQTKKTLPLLAAASPAALTVRALTGEWVVWSVGVGSSTARWLLQAMRLPQGDAALASPVTLVNSGALGADTPATLGGVWAMGSMVLVAGATATQGELLRFDLSSGLPEMTMIAHSAALGHLLTDPSFNNGLYYWADVWFDSATGLHSTVWRGDDSGQDVEISTNDVAFHPRATHGMLVWVEVAPETVDQMMPLSGATPTDDDELMLNELNGSLFARNLSGGQQWQVSQRADVTSIETGGPLLLWHSDSQTHLYNLRSRTAGAVDGELRGSAYASANDTAVVWQSSMSAGLYVYDTNN